MAKHLVVYKRELQEGDLDRLRSMDFTITENGKGKITIDLPVDWEMQHYGPIFFLVVNAQGEPILNYMRGSGFFFRE